MRDYSFAVIEDKSEKDPSLRALELELAQKRASWTREREKLRNLRALSFGFLAVIIMGALVLFYLFFARTQEIRSHRPPASSEKSQR